MYKVNSIKIDGFWHRLSAQCDFNSEVNVIIGQNGSGKTTFMNILHSILTVDIPGLSENDFTNATVILSDDQDTRHIEVKKNDDDESDFPTIDYQIHDSHFQFPLFDNEDRRKPLSIRRRIEKEAAVTRSFLSELINISSLSVYRMRSDDDYEVRDRYGSRIISPVDHRLKEALNGLKDYLFKMANLVQKVSDQLQKDVLVSMLYTEEDDSNDTYLNITIFQLDEEINQLEAAYEQLNASDQVIKNKIALHVKAIAQVIQAIKSEDDDAVDFKPLEAYRKTRKIIALSLSAQDSTNTIYFQRDLFLDTLRDFMPGKKFTFIDAMLTISNVYGDIHFSRLSSGEKQLIILMVEALLQEQKTNVFLADEPELSLHIAWQRKIIPAIRKINPNGQVIVATHSPEVASKYQNVITDMKAIIHE